MRVALAKGRIDHEAERTFARGLPHLPAKPPYYFFSWIAHDLEPACRDQGWHVDVFSIGKPVRRRIPLPDVLVNLISEPLVCRRALDRLDEIVRRHKLPLLNNVAAVRRSSRTELPRLIAASAAARVHAPPTTCFIGHPGGLAKHIEAAGHRWPVLLRPAGLHSSEGLRKFDTTSDLGEVEPIPSDFLVSDFADFRSGDGLYRKYRMIWVDGAVFRRHLIAGLEWNVTGQSRYAMLERPETIAAEKHYLASAGDALDERVAELFRIVGLDFGVIDFAVSDSGEIVVFELNGTFQISGSIPAERRETWSYLEANNEEIVSALVASISRRAGSRIE